MGKELKYTLPNEALLTREEKEFELVALDIAKKLTDMRLSAALRCLERARFFIEYTHQIDGSRIEKLRESYEKVAPWEEQEAPGFAGGEEISIPAMGAA